MRRPDLTPFLFAVLALFIAVSGFQFSHTWTDGQRGLLSFENACAIYPRSI